VYEHLVYEHRINFLFATLGRHFVEREHTVELRKAIRIEVSRWALLGKPIPMRIFSAQQHRAGSGEIGFLHVRSHIMDRQSDTAVVCGISVRRVKRIFFVKGELTSLERHMRGTAFVYPFDGLTTREELSPNFGDGRGQAAAA
jgi:hypothetical protein